MFKPIRTPCIGVCSTGIGDSVCRGCKRFAHEVIQWNAYNHDERAAIDARLQSLLRQVMEPKLTVVDARLLQQQIELQRIRYNPSHHCYSWAFDLLKAGASQIEDIREFGCVLSAQWSARPLAELKLAIDADMYTLSCAHYERYIAPSFSPSPTE